MFQCSLLNIALRFVKYGDKRLKFTSHWVTVICRLHRLIPPLICYCFSSPPSFPVMGRSFLSFWVPNAACYGMALVSHWRFPESHRMNTSADVLNSKLITTVWILLKPGLLHLQFCGFGISLGVLSFCIVCILFVLAEESPFFSSYAYMIMDSK